MTRHFGVKLKKGKDFLSLLPCIHLHSLIRYLDICVCNKDSEKRNYSMLQREEKMSLQLDLGGDFYVCKPTAFQSRTLKTQVS